MQKQGICECMLCFCMIINIVRAGGGADLCSKVRKSRGVRGITTDEKEKNIIKTPRKYLGVFISSGNWI